MLQDLFRNSRRVRGISSAQMKRSVSRHLVIVLYVLAGVLLAVSIVPFLYQYAAAIGSYGKVIPAFGNARILTALWLSLLSACVTTALALLLGVPLGYVFARVEFRGKKIVET